jgi:hypothetical protein
MAKLPPYLECEFKAADVAAIQAMEAGTATPDQQKRAFEWLLVGAARVRQPSFQPNDPHGTAFAEGRRYVGLQIGLMRTLNVADVAIRDRKADQADRERAIARSQASTPKERTK